MYFNNILLIHVFEYTVYVVSISMVYRLFGKSSSAYTIPLYALLFMFSSITPISLRIGFEYIIAFIVLASSYILLTLSYMDKAFHTYGLAYLVIYFFMGIVPYVLTNCSTLSPTCLYLKPLTSLFEVFIVLIGLSMLFALSTITYSVGDRLDYVFFYISSLSFIVSNYLVLLRPLSNNSILLSTSTIIVSVIVYFLGGEIGGYIYDDLEVNRVFDKYVSINAPLVFIVLAITLVYTVVWS